MIFKHSLPKIIPWARRKSDETPSKMPWASSKNNRQPITRFPRAHILAQTMPRASGQDTRSSPQKPSLYYILSPACLRAHVLTSRGAVGRKKKQKRVGNRHHPPKRFSLNRAEVHRDRWKNITGFINRWTDQMRQIRLGYFGKSWATAWGEAGQNWVGGDGFG